MMFRRTSSLLAQSRRDPDALRRSTTPTPSACCLPGRRKLDVDTSFDLLSETPATALERRHQFRGLRLCSAEEEQGWLFSLARSEMSHYWRDGRVERIALARLGVGVPALSDPVIERIEQLAGINELVPALHDAMAALPEDQRRAVELRVVEEHGYAEVASILGVEADGARPRLARLRGRSRAGCRSRPPDRGRRMSACERGRSTRRPDRGRRVRVRPTAVTSVALGIR
jgi:RNA polymerase sigma-70 factor (ECF subfamily)